MNNHRICSPPRGRAILRAPVSTVRYWRYLSTGPNCFKLGRRVVYRRADVHTWLAAQEAAGRGRAAS